VKNRSSGRGSTRFAEEMRCIHSPESVSGPSDCVPRTVDVSEESGADQDQVTAEMLGAEPGLGQIRPVHRLVLQRYVAPERVSLSFRGRWPTFPCHSMVDSTRSGGDVECDTKFGKYGTAPSNYLTNTPIWNVRKTGRSFTNNILVIRP
jgi:hypothetical protein